VFFKCVFRFLGVICVVGTLDDPAHHFRGIRQPVTRRAGALARPGQNQGTSDQEQRTYDCTIHVKTINTSGLISPIRNYPAGSLIRLRENYPELDL
jgi:hypothetical protein